MPEQTTPRADELDQVADLDTVYRWPDGMTATARSRMRHFSAADMPDRHRSLYVTFVRDAKPPAGDPGDDAAAAGGDGELDDRGGGLRRGEGDTVRAARPTPGQRDDPYAAHGVFAGPPSLVPNHDQTVELFTAMREQRPAMVATTAAQFATVTTTGTGTDTQLLTDRVGPTPRRIADIAALQTQEVGMASGVAFPVFGAGTAGTTAEAAAKGEYDNITAGTATPQVIAAWTDITLQTEALLSFENKLRNKISRLIAARENELLRAKVAGTSGIQTLEFVDGSQSARILQGAALVESAVNTRPDVFLFNPADTEVIFGAQVGNAAPAEVARMILVLHGMIGVPLSTQPAGFVLAGAWQATSRFVVGLRPVFKVDPFSQMKSNIVTVLGEEAVDLAVEEPEGFISIDIASAA